MPQSQTPQTQIQTQEIERLKEIVRRAVRGEEQFDEVLRGKVVVARKKNAVVVLYEDAVYAYLMKSEDRARKLAKLFGFAEYFGPERVLDVVEEYMRHLGLMMDDEDGWYHVEAEVERRNAIVRTARSRNIIVVEVEEKGYLRDVSVFAVKSEERAEKLHEFMETAFEVFYPAPWFIAWLIDGEEHSVESKGVVYHFVHEK